jgi:glutamate dehydrogenase
LLPDVLSPADRVAFDASVKRLTGEGVPPELAGRFAELEGLYAVLDATEVAVEQKKPIELVGALYFALVGELDLRWIGEKITQLPTDTSWQALARNALRDDLASQQRALTSTVAKLSPDASDPAQMLGAWKERYAPAITRYRNMVEELKRLPSLDLAVLSVLLRELRTLA